MNLYNNGNDKDYMINQDAMTTNVNISFDKCKVSKTRGILRVQGGGIGCSINNIEFTNTTFSEIGSYGVIHTKDMTGNLNSIHISKCTFNDVAATNGATFTLTAKIQRILSHLISSNVHSILVFKLAINTLLMQTKWNYTISESQNAYSPTVVAAMPKTNYVA